MKAVVKHLPKNQEKKDVVPQQQTMTRMEFLKVAQWDKNTQYYLEYDLKGDRYFIQIFVPSISKVGIFKLAEGDELNEPPVQTR